LCFFLHVALQYFTCLHLLVSSSNASSHFDFDAPTLKLSDVLILFIVSAETLYATLNITP